MSFIYPLSKHLFSVHYGVFTIRHIPNLWGYKDEKMTIFALKMLSM